MSRVGLHGFVEFYQRPLTLKYQAFYDNIKAITVIQFYIFAQNGKRLLPFKREPMYKVPGINIFYKLILTGQAPNADELQ